MPIVYYLCLTLGQAWDLAENLSSFLKYRHMGSYADIGIIPHLNAYSFFISSAGYFSVGRFVMIVSYVSSDIGNRTILNDNL